MGVRAVLAATAAIAALAAAAPAHGSCVPMTEREQIDRATVIFVGVALEGPTASGVQRFRVEQYVKGDGDDTVAVSTGVARRADGTGWTTSVAIDDAAGERWRILATRAESGVLTTSVCDGSKAIGGSASGDAWPQEGATATGNASATESRPALVAVLAAVAILGVAALAFAGRRRLSARQREASV
jgi:hypothetical protein